MSDSLNILTVIIALVGLAGNAIVLWLLGFRMHRNAFSVYILNLAGADFLILSFQILNSVRVIDYEVHQIYIDVSDYWAILFNFAYLAGLSMLSAMSTERCLSVMCPIWYRCHRPRHTSAVMCALLWALSLLLNLLEGEACGFLFHDIHPHWCQKLDLITFAWLTVLFVVLSGSSLALLVKIFCGSQRLLVTRLYVTIAFTVLVFFIFGLPYGINWFFLYWTVEMDEVFPCNVSEITVFLSSVNSCANPIIYFLVGSIRYRRFQKKTLKVILQRALKDTPEEEGVIQGSSGKSG
ncbi:mas-related G-protein coupled receptor member B1-like [Acomys russatus]|uniref:mas-related G-protein coupled receptor member B1-like n=1 Tax=Acomys russatus TaxID=60746 RepID=UPI0021E276B3|nr:mas-related G-protein coupled receptor member B1-like [Acomys russatus]